MTNVLRTRQQLRSAEPNTPSGLRRMILIDDDRTYQKLLKRSALVKGIDLYTYPSLEDLGSVARLADFDVAIFDYDLGNMTGPEIAEYTYALMSKLPVVLVSSEHRYAGDKPWPPSIVTFIRKSLGHNYVIEQAMACAKKHSNHSRVVT